MKTCLSFCGVAVPLCGSKSAALFLPAPNRLLQRHGPSNHRRMILPLPEGEGKGEGERAQPVKNQRPLWKFLVSADMHSPPSLSF